MTPLLRPSSVDSRPGGAGGTRPAPWGLRATVAVVGLLSLLGYAIGTPSEEIGRVLLLQLWTEMVRGVMMLVFFAVLGIVLLRIGRRQNRGNVGTFQVGMAAVAAYLVLVPTAMHAWYAVWIVPFLTVYRSPAWLWFTATVPLSYLKYAWEPAGLPLWLRSIEFLPLYALLVWEWQTGRLPEFRSHTARSPGPKGWSLEERGPQPGGTSHETLRRPSGSDRSAL